LNSKIVKEWLKKADQDYECARYLKHRRRRPLYDIICFHCQQCAEKYFKAYLTSKRKRFPKTHDLTKLLELTVVVDGSFDLLKDIILPLNDYAVVSRYPGEEADRKESLQAIKAMEEIRKFVRQKLK